MAIVKDICRFICGLIDSIAYLILSKLSDLFNEISQLSLYSEEVMNSIGQRIGLILGIFMLFRLAVALVSYIISPDTMKDSGKGTGKMIKSIIISLILLATVNIIFKEAYKLQRKVIESKIVEKIFFGEQAMVSDINISFILYDAFIDPNPRVLANCETLFDLYNPVVNSDCKNSINNASLNSVAYNTISDSILRYHTFQDLLSTYDALNAKKGNEYVFNYTPVISTISSVIAILILIGFCMDLATRIVKLLFLQIIAPVPIVSNMAPGKGSDVFKNWYKQCINTYLSVFIRIIALNFGIFMITLIKTKFSDIFTGASPFITVLLIIGCLMFAKQVPKLLEEIMGIKMDGGMTLNPLKKFQDQALFGKNIIGLGAAGLAGTAALGTNMAARFKMGMGEKGYKKAWDVTLGTIASGVAGGLSAATRGTLGALKGDKFGQVYSNAYGGAIRARNNRNSRIASKILGPQVWLNNLERKMGIETVAEGQDEQIKLYDDFTASGEAAVSISESELDKFADKIYISRFNGNSGVTVANLAGSTSTFNTLAELREAMSDNNNYDATTRAYLNSEYNRLRGDVAEDIRTEIYNGTAATNAHYSFTDSTGTLRYMFDANNASAATIYGHMKNTAEIISSHKDDAIFKGKTIDGKTVKSIAKQTKSASATIKNSDAYRKAHKIQEQTNKEKK